MGGKRTSTGRSDSGGQMQPRISSAGSTKSSIIESLSTGPSGLRKRDCSLNNEDDSMDYSNAVRKSSFDIISLLEGQGDDAQEVKMSNREDDNHFFSHSETRARDSSDVPSFWRFVQPESTHHEIFHHHNHPPHHHHYQNDKKKEKHQISNITTKTATGLTPFPAGSTKLVNQKKRPVRRRKSKKVQSAKVASFEALEKSPERLQREGVEWLRVLTPPRSTSTRDDGADADEDDEEIGDEGDEEDDEIIRRYFSGLSSAGSSISWAEDAMESEFTMQLMKLWEDIEDVCGGGNRPEKMSDAVYEECLQWRKAFPNPDLHRFSSFQNDAELSPSPTIEDSVGVDDDAPYSSLVNSPRFLNNEKSRQGNDDATFDQTMNTLQTNFRALNCATPRPNIEKSTEYVNAWLSECQNSYNVPAHLDHNLPTRTASPSTSIIDVPMISKATANDEIGSRGRHSLKVISDVARSSYTSYSRSHSKFIADQNSGSFFPSLAMSNEDKNQSSSFNDRNGLYSSGITQLPEEYEEEDRVSPIADDLTEIGLRRTNVRVQRPISSRVRDHTITPIATRSAFNAPTSYYGNRQSFSKPTSDIRFGKPTSKPFDDFIPGSRSGIGRICEEDQVSASPPSSAAVRSRMSNSRIRSGIGMKEAYNSSLTHPYHFGKSRNSQQTQWSRYTDEDPEIETNHFSFVENHSNFNGGTSTFETSPEVGFNNRTNFPSIRPVTDDYASPTRSAKNRFPEFPRSSTADIYGCDGATFNKPMVSLLMNRRLSPN